MYLVFTRMPGESYRRRLRSLLLSLRDVFRALINSLACWYSSGWLEFPFLPMPSCLPVNFCTIAQDCQKRWHETSDGWLQGSRRVPHAAVRWYKIKSVSIKILIDEKVNKKSPERRLIGQVNSNSPQKERERENSNSKTLFYNDCSLGSLKNLSNN